MARREQHRNGSRGPVSGAGPHQKATSDPLNDERRPIETRENNTTAAITSSCKDGCNRGNNNLGSATKAASITNTADTSPSTATPTPDPYMG